MVVPGRVGQFDVVMDESVIASRGGNAITRPLFGAGFPDLDSVVADIEKQRA